jgi:hypothetical protein
VLRRSHPHSEVEPYPEGEPLLLLIADYQVLAYEAPEGIRVQSDRECGRMAPLWTRSRSLRRKRAPKFYDIMRRPRTVRSVRFRRPGRERVNAFAPYRSTSRAQHVGHRFVLHDL